MGRGGVGWMVEKKIVIFFFGFFNFFVGFDSFDMVLIYGFFLSLSGCRVWGGHTAVKAVHRSVAEIVILAADTEPIEIVLQLPLLCEDKGIPYVWVRSRQALGRAVGLSRPAIAVAIVGQEGSQLKNQINSMKDAVEQLLI